MPQLWLLEWLSSHVVSSHLVIEAFQDGNLSMLDLIKLLLVSCMLVHHGPKWVTCPRQESVLEGLHKGLGTRKYNSLGTIITIFYRQCSVHIDFSFPHMENILNIMEDSQVPNNHSIKLNIHNLVICFRSRCGNACLVQSVLIQKPVQRVY